MKVVYSHLNTNWSFMFRGSWAMHRVIADSKIMDLISALPANASGLKTAAAMFHPSIRFEESVHKGDPLRLISEAKCPVFYLPAGNDPKEYWPPDGAYVRTAQQVHKASKSKVYEAMTHGWVSRGDYSNPSTREAMEDAVVQALTFLKENVAGLV